MKLYEALSLKEWPNPVEDVEVEFEPEREEHKEEVFPNPDKHKEIDEWKDVKIYFCKDCGKFAAMVNGEKVKKDTVKELRDFIDTVTESCHKKVNESEEFIDPVEEYVEGCKGGHCKKQINEEIGEPDTIVLDGHTFEQTEAEGEYYMV